ncbi:DUF4277 domain-containing protein [Streptomyces sp. ADI95-17]|uniref:DUF4277 domain-containing protein n=1 Tax=Streptomyces sp. ADI95-17 TaxID=1522759 RepID=UPI001F154392|nr:DUF4277 domain-containing protein [Streptomyces sp. ADI95-17]
MVEKHLGALSVAARFLRGLDVAGTVDRLRPGRDIAHVTHGQVIEVLMVNRSAAPWRRVDRWAREWAVEDDFGTEAQPLDDDRLGQAADAIAPHLRKLTDSVGVLAIGEFGSSRSGSGPGVTGDGGIPLLSRVIDGGAAEISQIIGTMNAPRAIAGPKEFQPIADSKLISSGNVAALIKVGDRFHRPGPHFQVDDAVYAALDLEVATVVDHSPVRDEDIPAAERETCRVLEDVATGRT